VRLSKALTGGYLPMAVCLTTGQEWYEAFYTHYSPCVPFLATPTSYTEPTGLRRRVATLDFVRAEDNVIERQQGTVGAYRAKPLQHLPITRTSPEVRQTGTGLAIEMVSEPKPTHGLTPGRTRWHRVYEACAEK